MAISIKDIYAKRNTSTYTKAGFKSGIVTGILYGITAFIVILLYKEKVLLQLDAFVKSVGKAVPMSAIALYNLALWVSGPATILLYSLLGIIFGLMCDKYRLESTWKILSLSLLVGIVLGLVTHLPIPPVVIILSSMAAWLVFGVLFRLMIKKD
jgi:hypothetical protein